MKYRTLNPALGVMALLAVASVASAQVTFNIPTANFAANPGTLTNAGGPSGGANSTHTATTTSAFMLGTNVTVHTAVITAFAGSGTYAVEASMKLTNNMAPGATYFRFSDLVGTYEGAPITITTDTVRGLGSSSYWTTLSVASTMVTGTAIPAGSIWTAEAYDSYDDNAAGNDSTGTGIAFTVNAVVPPPPPLPVIYNNGGIVNDPDAGYLGADVSHELDTATAGIGFTCAPTAAPAFRIADDFTVPAGGWDVGAISIYTLSVGTWPDVPASNVFSINMEILNGPPGVGSVVATSNSLRFSEWAGIYRQGFGYAIGDHTLPVFRSEAGFTGLHLNPGTYWINYQVTAGATAYSPTVMDPTMPPSSPVGNGMQMTATGWTTLLNDGQQVDFPFLVHGLASQSLTGNLVLNNTVASFSYSTPISYQVKQGATTLGSGTITAGATSTSFSMNAGSGTGAAKVILTGGPFLREVYDVNLTGSNQNVGTLTMRNGNVVSDEEVGPTDIDAVIAAFGEQSGTNANCDRDFEVGPVDIDIVVANFGEQIDALP